MLKNSFPGLAKAGNGHREVHVKYVAADGYGSFRAIYSVQVVVTTPYVSATAGLVFRTEYILRTPYICVLLSK